MKFELCTDTVNGAVMASKYGFTSIELCSALSVGGLTPNYGLIEQCVAKSNVEVHVMIRHREGGFQCDRADVELMTKDIKAVKRAGGHGVVFGILDEGNQVADLNKDLLTFAHSLSLSTTFHRAFDFVPDYKVAIRKIIDFGFDRLLTSGLKPKAEQGIELLKALQLSWGNDICIIAGSGINESNALRFEKSGISYIHFTARKPSKGLSQFGMGQSMYTDEDKIKRVRSGFTESQK